MRNDSELNQEKPRFTDRIVKVFLHSNLSIVLILASIVIGMIAIFFTPREEDPQIIVPLADVYVNFPGHTAAEVEQLVSTPLEKNLYQIDGVEYVYSMSRENQAIITVRYYVGEDRERSLVKLYKKIDENLDIVPSGVTGWVIKPVEIDDVPIVTLTLTSKTSDYMSLRRVAEEISQQLSGIKNVSRAYIVGGSARIVKVYMDTDRMAAYHVSPSDIEDSIKSFNLQITAGDFRSGDKLINVAVGNTIKDARQLNNFVITVYDGRPVFLKDVAEVVDGPEEISNYVRHGWGSAKGFVKHANSPGSIVGEKTKTGENSSFPATTIAIAKKKGSNAVWVANDVLSCADNLKKTIVPEDMDLVITRNYGLTANEKVDELIWALIAAVIIIVALLTLGLGWREAMVVALAIPVVFGLALGINMMLGFTINRVTLFALILSLGLLVDDPIVDVENISRHFAIEKNASLGTVLKAVSEIRPPLIIATLAVIVSFIPMFFITGMMGPYMRPMALNVPVTMLLSMLISFTITPWFAYHMLKRKYSKISAEGLTKNDHDGNNAKDTKLYRFFYPLMEPLLRSRINSWIFIGIIVILTIGAISLAIFRGVPLKMLPYDNKNELQLVLNFDEGTTLERTDAALRDFEKYISTVPEVVDYISYTGIPSPMDFNGLVRHYYLRNQENMAEIRINLADKSNRSLQSHAIALRMRNALQTIADKHTARMKIVETPPGPPVISSIVAEIYGQPGDSYEKLLSAADTVKARFLAESGVSDIDTVREVPREKLIFVPDNEKAALQGISAKTIADTIKTTISGSVVDIVHSQTERNPLKIELRLLESQRSNISDLSKVYIKGKTGQIIPLSELGEWKKSVVDQQIYHKNLQRVSYVFAESIGRTPAEVVSDIQSDKVKFNSPIKDEKKEVGNGFVSNSATIPISKRTFLTNGSGINWAVPDGIDVIFAGEGEWKITLDVFRDLGLAFAAAIIGIYILLIVQTGSFRIPIIVMLAIPLTILGVMPGFWMLNLIGAQHVGGYINPIYFTATGMIGMIALSGIVTRDSIILVDFIHLSLARGNTLFDAIMESRVVRLRPILLTTGAAMLGAVPIIIDPIFSGLAWALIFGLFASTLFTLFVIPVAYWLLYSNKPG